jgi:hypothetical protein
VSLGANAIANIASAVSGSVVSISNFPASQTVAGTVTAGNIPVFLEGLGDAPCVRVGGVGVDGAVLSEISNQVRIISSDSNSIIPISGTVTANVAGNLNSTLEYDGSTFFVKVAGRSAGGKTDYPINISGTVTVGNSLTISSLPAISGTVTANLASQAKGPIVEIDSAIPADPKYMAVVGGFYLTGNEYRAIRLESNGEIAVGSLPAISGTVTIGSLPRVTFIDGSGTVVTANSAVTLFASSSTRSYLLVQVTTGSAFVNVGATATTVNGINLTAGQGYAWETTIPQGLVSLISTTTSSRWVAKEA